MVLDENYAIEHLPAANCLNTRTICMRNAVFERSMTE
jgi:hypothetical protein